jgi:O-acetyl-ADP-ribose deacetylase (regulator of RNase III)
MIVERTGDLFTSECQALGLGVNTLGSMAAGIAVESRRRWPAMYDAYRMECQSGRLQPGGVFVYYAADRVIVNLGHAAWPRSRCARLEWIRQSARATAQLDVAGLALPHIGAGLGGLRWADVRAILEEELALLPYVELWPTPRVRLAVRSRACRRSTANWAVHLLPVCTCCMQVRAWVRARSLSRWLRSRRSPRCTCLRR